MRRLAIASALVLAIAGCAHQAPDPQESTNTARVEGKIVKACAASGLFKPVELAVEGAIEAALPIAALPIAVVNAGVHLVCVNPHAWAHDISTVEWVVRNLRQRASDRI